MTPGEKFTLTATDNGWLIDWTNLAGIRTQMVFGSQRRLLAWLAVTVPIAELVDEEYWDQPSYRRAASRTAVSGSGGPMAVIDPGVWDGSTTSVSAREAPSAGLEPSGGTFGGGGASGSWNTGETGSSGVLGGTD